MEDQTNIYIIKPNRKPWNKGKLIGQKPPLQPKHVWAIRTRLQISKKICGLQKPWQIGHSLELNYK